MTNEVLNAVSTVGFPIVMCGGFGYFLYIIITKLLTQIDKFGESAPGEEVMKEYGFTVENVVKRAKELLQ